MDGGEVFTDLQRGDRVITPTDEIAIVYAVDPLDRRRVEVTYIGALNREHAMVSLHTKLLVKWPGGVPRPRPVRVR